MEFIDYLRAFGNFLAWFVGVITIFLFATGLNRWFSNKVDSLFKKLRESGKPLK